MIKNFFITESIGRDETDHGSDQMKQEDEAAVLASDLKGNLSRIITFSNDQLQVICCAV